VIAPDPQTTALPLAVARRVDAVSCNFEAAWKAAAAGGERPRLEAYLEGVTQPARGALIGELLRIDAHHRRRAGELPQAADYQARFPDLDPGWLAALVAPHRARAPARSELVVPGYEVLGELGWGGMGIVYKARQVKLNRVVALKMILAGGHARPRERHRFRREAEAVAQLQHPHIVQVHNVGEHEGHPYLALEFVPGGSLDRHLAGTPQPARAAAALIETLAQAVRLSGGRPQDHRFRAGQAAGRHLGGPDPQRRRARHSQLHGARTGGEAQ
jgi:hypothetical protein